ncbi:hypothetical protein CEXT_146521 [Caerostris extrusa]|uniref:Uncharacterized protein n=1 Tax=Caerostris extrusa TaxID=172846 RepID=A0AAV4RIM1_CAEEX|nr:hypothetical protein CEXT_146521 [Caerostris extrusa]
MTEHYFTILIGTLLLKYFGLLRGVILRLSVLGWPDAGIKCKGLNSIRQLRSLWNNPETIKKATNNLAESYCCLNNGIQQQKQKQKPPNADITTFSLEISVTFHRRCASGLQYSGANTNCPIK